MGQSRDHRRRLFRSGECACRLGVCGPTHDERSWTFDLDPGGVDPVLSIARLRPAYLTRVPDYPKGITVPAIVDVPTGEVVTNDFAQMTLDFSTEWAKFHRDGAPQLYPDKLRDEIDDVAKRIYTEVNNGVYRCGFAGSQESYDKAYDRLFTALDWLSERLGRAALPRRRHGRRGRRPAVHHAGALRRRLSRSLQDQPEPARRDAGAWAVARDLFQHWFGDTTTTSRSSGTTTSCTRTSTRLRLCPRGQTCPTGSPHTAGKPWAADRLATAHRGRAPEGERVPDGHGAG